MTQTTPYQKLVVLALLIVNAGIFLYRGEYNDSFDSLAWIVLMGIYELNTGKLEPLFAPKADIQGIRMLAIGVVLVAEISYFFEGAWLDGIYSFEWILVIGLFELETRAPRWVRAHPVIFRGAALMVMTSMLAVIFAWLGEGAYFNAYDALIWSLAFIIIDLDILNRALSLDQASRSQKTL